MDDKVKKLAQLLESPEQSPIPFSVYQFVNHKIRVILVSEGLCQLMNTPREVLMERLANNRYENVEADDVVTIATAAQEFAVRGIPYDVIYREKISGMEEPQIFHATGKHIYAPDGERFGLIRYEIIPSSVTSSNLAIYAYKDVLKKFYDEEDQALCVITKDDTTILYTNRQFCALLPPKRSFTVGVTFCDYFCDRPHPELTELFAQWCDKGRQLIEEIETGKPLVIRVRQVEWSGTAAYILYLEEQRKEYRDKLTNLPNQAYFKLVADHFCKKLLDANQVPACLFYNVIGMKIYNAQNGFSAGDILLQSIAKILKSIYTDALIARFDNDHFCLISTEEGMIDKIQAMNQEVAKLGGASKIETKVGICCIHRGEEHTVSEMCDRARIAGNSIKYDADRFYNIYDVSFEKELAERKMITERLEYAIENDEIQVYYQPIIRTLTGQLCGFEALARWISPELGFLSPGRFIPALEASRQIYKLDIFMIRQICRELSNYIRQKDAPFVPVSFNLSRLDFKLCDIFRIVEDAVKENDLPRSMLNIEITESLMVEDVLIREEIRKFHDAGYKVWMDDFGSGYSSLNTLKDYDFDKIKIDMLFLSSFTQKSKDIISSIVSMAKRIGIRTLAEGCETQEQYEFLQSIGCEEVQGYYFGKPSPGAESVHKIFDRHFIAEKSNDREIFETAGRTSFQEGTPLAVLDNTEDTFFLLYSNKETEQLLEYLETTGPAVIQAMNQVGGTYHNMFQSKIKECKERKQATRFSFSVHNTYLSVTLTIIAFNADHTVFKVELFDTKISLEKAAPKVSQITRRNPQHKRTILIADDEPINCMILGEMLKDHYNIVYAEDGQQALDKIFEDPDAFSAVILDMVMPKVDGMQVLFRIRTTEKTRYLPVIAMTSATDLEIDLLHNGVNQFFFKPLEDQELVLAKIENVIRNTEGR